jgi:hypothetical protein
MARTPPVTAPAAGTAAARELQMIRVGYGAALVLMPGTTIFLATGRVPGRRTRRVAQVLGARHLAQAAVTAFAPVPDVLALGAEVDAAHAASMVALATASRAARHAAMTDALAEAVFAAIGWGAGAKDGGGAKRGRG